LIGGIRLEEIKLARTHMMSRPLGPATVIFRNQIYAGDGRIGYVWEAVPD